MAKSKRLYSFQRLTHKVRVKCLLFNNIIVYCSYDAVGREFQLLFLSTSEATEADASTCNPIRSLCNPFVFNTVITRAQSLVVSVGNPFLLLKTERHMIKRYGNKARCWSTYLEYCLQKNTFKFHSGQQLKEEDKAAIYKTLDEMIKANETFDHKNQLHSTDGAPESAIHPRPTPQKKSSRLKKSVLDKSSK